MIDEEIIEVKIDIILTNLRYLDTVRKERKNDFIDSFEKIQATKHSLQESIEASLDIANHIISEKRWDRAETYAEMFKRLYDHQIVDQKLMNSLSDMARFRNLLVHRYGIVDTERLWLIIQENLEDFEFFIKKIQLFIQKNND